MGRFRRTARGILQGVTDRPDKGDLAHDSGSFPEPLPIMGVNVVPFESYSHVVRCVEESISKGRKTLCFAINPEKIYRANRDPRLLDTLRHADFAICDGIGITMAVVVLHGKKISRCTGCDLFFRLLAAASRNGWKVFMLGADPESNKLACLKLQERYPGLQVVGRRDGYFSDSGEVIRQINESRAQLLFVAMGSPRQELWLAQHRHAIRAPFCMGVGGSFDVASGQVKRAPVLFRKTGTEFVFRLMSEPSRWRRQLALPGFMLAVLKKKFLWRREVL